MANSFKVEWLKQIVAQIRTVIPVEEYSNEELKKTLLDIFENRKTVNGRFLNNTTNENKVISVESFINYFLNSNSILTGYNVLIKNQNEQTSIAIKALENILDQRKHYKKLMEQSEKGSHEYYYNRVMQLTFKILANSYYGITSMGTSIFYNPLIQNSITTTGQDLIASAIYLVEDLIANNEKYENFDDILRFVAEVKKEKYSIQEFLDRNITNEELFKYLVNHSTFNFTEEQKYILQKGILKLTEEERNKIYYKNQIPELLKNKYFKDKLPEIFKTGNVNKDFINDIVNISVCPLISWNKFIRVSTQKRRASIVTDTDSTFVYLGKLVKSMQELSSDYEDEDKQNILNFLIEILTESLTKIFNRLSTNIQIPEEYQSIINMKNEFVYSRIMTTRNKKNYGGWLRSELGKVIPGDSLKKHLDIKGLSIRKSTVAKSIREEFQKLLVNDILLPKNINIKEVIKHYNEISNIVETSLKNGNTEYLVPKSVDAFTKYVNPGSIEQVKATIIWNSLEPNEAITPPDTVYTLKIDAPTENCPAMQKLKEIAPDKYDIIMKTVFKTEPGELNISSNGFSVVAIPLDKDKIPEYIRPIINYELMTNINVKNANILLESLGLICIDDKVNKTNYKTNIVEWD